MARFFEMSKAVDQIIDYAGLFPPAALESSQAVQEFFSLCDDSRFAPFFKRFILPLNPQNRLHELLHLFKLEPDLNGRRVFVSLLLPQAVGLTRSPIEIENEVCRGFEEVFDLLDSEAYIQSCLCLDSVEFLLPNAQMPEKHAAKFQNVENLWTTCWPSFEDKLNRISTQFPNLPVYIEQDWQLWNSDCVKSIQILRERFPNVFVKIRTGGLKAETVPPASVLSRIIADLVAAQIGFKFTAGLHSALYETSPRFQFDMHGFLNVLSAVALAKSGTEAWFLEKILLIRKPEKLMRELFEHLGSNVGESLHGARRLMHSFGSCSVSEPVESLRLHGFL